MSRQSILLLMLIVLPLAAAAAGESANEYDQINAHLASLSRDQQEDVEALMGELERMLAARNSDALRQILSLKLVEKEPCERETFELLRRNDLATGGRARSSSSRPIDRLLHHYLLLRAKRCQKVYLKRFKQLYHFQMDDKFLDRMDPFLWRTIEGQLERRFKRNFEQLKPWQLVEGLKGISRLTEEDAEVVQEELSRLASRDPKRACLMSEIDEKCIAELVNKYFGATCDRYFADLGPRVFEQAAFDDRVLPEGQRRAKDLSQFQYYLGWASYSLCSWIGQNELSVAKMWAVN